VVVTAAVASAVAGRKARIDTARELRYLDDERMTRSRRRGTTALPALLAMLVACSSPVAYRADEEVLHGMTRDQREQLFAETLSRARKPRIYQVWIDDSSYGYDSEVPMRDGFGIPVGYAGRRRIVYFANVRELRLYDNHAVFVFDTTGRLVDKIQFGYREDAERMIDLIASYRAQRLTGTASPGPARPSGHRYDRRYEQRGDERDRDDPRYDPRYDEPYDGYEDRAPR
jgi:hypothetical protein